jgi:hypothetical protein
VQWPGSFCNDASKCCMPLTGEPVLDFLVESMETYDSYSGKVVTDCNQTCYFYTNQVILVPDFSGDCSDRKKYHLMLVQCTLFWFDVFYNLVYHCTVNFTWYFGSMRLCVYPSKLFFTPFLILFFCDPWKIWN